MRPWRCCPISGRPRRPKLTDHSRETGSIATACLARSSSPPSPTTHSRSNGDFPEPSDKPRIGGVESPRSFRPLCLRAENSVSPQQRLRFEETGSNAMSMRAAPSPTALSPRVEHSDLLQARPAEACRGASHDGDDMAIMTTMPEEQLMPLSRLNAWAVIGDGTYMGYSVRHVRRKQP